MNYCQTLRRRCDDEQSPSDRISQRSVAISRNLWLQGFDACLSYLQVNAVRDHVLPQIRNTRRFVQIYFRARCSASVSCNPMLSGAAVRPNLSVFFSFGALSAWVSSGYLYTPRTWWLKAGYVKKTSRADPAFRLQ
jgi:hypothetical protein